MKMRIMLVQHKINSHKTLMMPKVQQIILAALTPIKLPLSPTTSAELSPKMPYSILEPKIIKRKKLISNSSNYRRKAIVI